MQPATSTADVRQRIVDLLNEALSAEYHSFVGHVLASNPYVVPGTEKDLEILERIRGEENDCTRALLVQLGRYRAGPTLKAFRWWKHDLNFLGTDFLVLKAAEIAKDEVGRVERQSKDLPDDAELRATFASILAVKKRHAEELGKLAATRGRERQARRDASHATTGIPLKKAAAPAAAKPAAAAPRAPGAPGAPKPPSPPLPGGAPRPPSPPLPPGAPKPPGVPKPPSPPLPPGMKLPGAPKPPSPPLPPGASKPSSPPLPPGFKAPGAPKPPSPPAPPAAPPAAAEPSAPAAPPAAPKKPGSPPLPPGFKLPPKPPSA